MWRARRHLTSSNSDSKRNEAVSRQFRAANALAQINKLSNQRHRDAVANGITEHLKAPLIHAKHPQPCRLSLEPNLIWKATGSDFGRLRQIATTRWPRPRDILVQTLESGVDTCKDLRPRNHRLIATIHGVLVPDIIGLHIGLVLILETIGQTQVK